MFLVKILSPTYFPITMQGADTGILCEEVGYDCGVLCDLIWQHLRREHINVVLVERAIKIAKTVEHYLIDIQNHAPIFADKLLMPHTAILTA